VVLLPEVLWADRALVGPFVCVASPVLSHVADVRIGFGAMWTFVGLLARVRPSVHHESLPGTEVGRAVGAGVWPLAHMGVDMHLEGGLIEESRLAV